MSKNSPISQLDPPQMIRRSYVEADDAFRVESISGSIVTEGFDFVSVAYPDSVTEVYTFKTGGAGGTTVATVTIVYTDSTKCDLSTVTKT